MGNIFFRCVVLAQVACCAGKVMIGIRLDIVVTASASRQTGGRRSFFHCGRAGWRGRRSFLVSASDKCQEQKGGQDHQIASHNLDTIP